MANERWTSIVIKALTIITIVWWLLTVVSKSIDYPYADAWVYTNGGYNYDIYFISCNNI